MGRLEAEDASMRRDVRRLIAFGVVWVCVLILLLVGVVAAVLWRLLV